MSTLHEATMSPTKLELVTAWMGAQRWYAAKGRVPVLELVHRWRLDDPEGEVGVETLLVRDTTGAAEGRAPILYQVPLTYRGAPAPELAHALVGTSEHSVLGTRWVYDGPHDPVYAAQLLALVQGRQTPQSSEVSDTVEASVAGHPHPAWPGVAEVAASRVLSGEQSNTSIIYDTAVSGEARPVICKVFRTLSPGENPDVVLQSALSEGGSTRVPAVVGWVSCGWPDAGGTASGHLAFAQEFLPGAEDAWRVTQRVVSAGESFAARAYDLGAATAEVHTILASTLPVEPATPERVAEQVANTRRRLVAALAEVPAIVAHEDEILAALTAAGQESWPDFQRVHGDYHLGQVLDVPGRGWVLLDFEGEPLRPLAERSVTDQPIRDVAGMLRSFDYAGATWERAHLGGSARAWVAEAQGAFLDGYAAVAGTDPRDRAVLLTLFLLDKALYEVVYEARNRPTWIPIPAQAIDSLLGPGALPARGEKEERS